jgi:ribulose-phosphate 3-epimerase
VIDLAFSILAADFTHLADEISTAERGGGTVCHVDVMDGHFVPNITFGPPVVAAVRRCTNLPLDVHLMIEDPDRYIADFARAGANWLIVHQEVCRHLHRTLTSIREHGMQPAVVINPATPVETILEVLPLVHHVLVMTVNPGFGGQSFIPRCVGKVEHLVALRQEMGLNFRIEVDGGIGEDTVEHVIRAGADLLVAGSAIYAGPGNAAQTERNAVEFLRRAKAATEVQA